MCRINCSAADRGGMGQQWTAAGQGLWVQQTWVWHKPSWRRSPLTHHRAARTYTGLGKQTLGGHKQNPVCTRTQEKGAVSPQEADPDLPISVQESPVEVWVSGGLQQGNANPCLYQRLLDTHMQVWVCLLWGHCSFLLGPGAHRALFVPSKSLFSSPV